MFSCSFSNLDSQLVKILIGCGSLLSLGFDGNKYSDTPPCSLKHSNANPKVKTMEEGVGVCFLTRNTLEVEGHVGAVGWGLR